jgi:hypothetical protein
MKISLQMSINRRFMNVSFPLEIIIGRSETEGSCSMETSAVLGSSVLYTIQSPRSLVFCGSPYTWSRHKAQNYTWDKDED